MSCKRFPGVVVWGGVLNADAILHRVSEEIEDRLY